MNAVQPRPPVRLADYRPPAFTTRKVELDFTLDAEATLVTARQHIERNPKGSGDELELLGEDSGAARAGDRRPEPAAERLSDRWRQDDPQGPASLLRAHRQDQDRAGAQHPADGALRLQRHLLHPVRGRGLPADHLVPGPPGRHGRAIAVRIEADKASFPALLSNGNPVAQRRPGRRPALRRCGRTRSPSPPICSRWWRAISPSSRTASPPGRAARWRCGSTSEAANIEQCHHAMASLKNSMKWDEDTYGLEYDLDLFHDRGGRRLQLRRHGEQGPQHLQYLGDAGAARHGDRRRLRQSVERIIAHEYFHNWTGNRVTCRDWFQLTLEGRPDGLPRPAVHGRHALGGGQADRRRGAAAREPVRRGCGPAGAPDPAGRLHRDQQFLHRARSTRRARRSSA